jgi:predicted nucleotidyltransferase
MTTEDLKRQIATYCATRPEIVASYLYGSRATRKEHPRSDVDLAFLVDNSVSKQAIRTLKMVYYSEVTRFVHLDIHILIMNEAGELVLGEVLREGVLLHVKQEDILERFRDRKIPLIAEFSYYSDLFRHKLVERYGGKDG